MAAIVIKWAMSWKSPAKSDMSHEATLIRHTIFREPLAVTHERAYMRMAAVEEYLEWW